MIDLEDVLSNAETLHSEAAVNAAYDRIAAEIASRLEARNPVVLAVMIGGLIPASHLVSRLSFPLQLDYVHASRYEGETPGSELRWMARPGTSLNGRVVLLVDDIFDEGVTVASISEECRIRGAREVLIAVLVRKHQRRTVPQLEPDFVGLEVDDRYVFGCGMDYRGYCRNLTAIYALGCERSRGASTPVGFSPPTPLRFRPGRLVRPQ